MVTYVDTCDIICGAGAVSNWRKDLAKVSGTSQLPARFHRVTCAVASADRNGVVPTNYMNKFRGARQGEQLGGVCGPSC